MYKAESTRIHENHEGEKDKEEWDSPGPKVIKHFFVLNSAEHEDFPANKSQITDNSEFFLAKYS